LFLAIILGFAALTLNGCANPLVTARDVVSGIKDIVREGAERRKEATVDQINQALTESATTGEKKPEAQNEKQETILEDHKITLKNGTERRLIVTTTDGTNRKLTVVPLDAPATLDKEAGTHPSGKVPEEKQGPKNK
jgi:isoaspartyl peptidase/L-asparaginase-like protein (Ntn-hydrolase superfamily)